MAKVETEAIKKAARKFGIGDVIGIGMDIWGTAGAYSDAIKEGKTKGQAFGAAAVEFVGWQIAKPLMIGGLAVEIVPSLVQAGLSTVKQNREYVSKAYRANFGGSYIDTQHAATMRSAGVAKISQSRASLAGSLGNEAKSYYRREAW